MKFSRTLAIPFLLGALLAGCTTTSGGSQSSMNDPLGKWVAIELGGVKLGPDFPATMTLEKGRVGGGSGCNRYFGAAEVNGAALTFGAIASSRMMCPPPAMEREQAMFTMLSDARTWRGEGADLLILNEKGEILARFAPQS